MNELNLFKKSSKPHNYPCSAPPNNKDLRYDWESKILYSVVTKLQNNCSILDYGCGVPSLYYNVSKRFNNVKYYGLDIDTHSEFSKYRKNNKNENIYLGNIGELKSISQKVDCIVAGSVFTHIDFEEITNILDSIKDFFNNGGEFGFTCFFGNSYNLFNKGAYSDTTYHVVCLTKKMLYEYCEKNNLKLTILPYTFMLDHIVKYDNYYFKEQYFCNIKKEEN